MSLKKSRSEAERVDNTLGVDGCHEVEAGTLHDGMLTSYRSTTYISLLNHNTFIRPPSAEDMWFNSCMVTVSVSQYPCNQSLLP